MEEYDLDPSTDASGLAEPVAQLGRRVAELLSREGNLHELTPEGGRGLVFWVLRDASHAEGFRMIPQLDETGLSERAMGFGAAPSRADGYPHDLPFLEDTAVIINPAGAKRRLHWIDVGDGLSALRGVVEQSQASGWSCREESPIELATRGTRYVEMEKGDRVRIATLRIHGWQAAELGMLEDAV